VESILRTLEANVPQVLALKILIMARSGYAGWHVT